MKPRGGDLRGGRPVEELHGVLPYAPQWHVRQADVQDVRQHGARLHLRPSPLALARYVRAW